MRCKRFSELEREIVELAGGRWWEAPPPLPQPERRVHRAPTPRDRRVRLKYRRKVANRHVPKQVFRASALVNELLREIGAADPL